MGAMNVAVCGLRHGHIAALIKKIRLCQEMEIVAVAERQPATCSKIVEAAGVTITHASLDELLATVDFDILAIGDVYALRGDIAVRALDAGKHILSDKPICTDLETLGRIAELSESRKLAVLAHLALRYQPHWAAARRALREGCIGELVTVGVAGRHPLDYGQGREAWYFEPGMHGGTLNDLGVHGLDGLEWLTGLSLAEVVAARSWNQAFPAVPHFENAAQAMLAFDTGAGVLMDVSYTAPRKHKERWTLHISGTEGDLLLTFGRGLTLRRAGEAACELEPDTTADRTLIDDLLAEIRGAPGPRVLTTAETLRATRLALLTQQAAERHVRLSFDGRV